MTVLLAVPTLDAGAGDDDALEIVRALTAAGHRAVVVSRGGRHQQDVTASGGTFLCHDVASKNPLVMLFNCLTLMRILRRESCDLVHAHGRAPGWSAYVAARIKGVPFVTTWYKGFREQNRVKRFYNSVMARGDRVIAVSPRLAGLIAGRHGTPHERIAVIPRLVDLGRFDLATVDAERIAAVRRRCGVTADTRVVLVVGRMLRRKGHHIVVQAMQHLQQRGMKNVVCVFIGEDPGHSRYVGQLWDLVLATGTSDVVRMVGPAQDMPATYAAADVVVSAAIQPEGLQRAILEAQAMGCPVIISDQGGGPEAAAAIGHTTGVSVPAGDPNELAAALVRILSLPEATRRAMGARGRELVVNHFRVETAAQSLLQLYAEVTGRAKPSHRHEH
jgi:glycosyltransferase involved in cell wall biosynthesis